MLSRIPNASYTMKGFRSSNVEFTLQESLLALFGCTVDSLQALWTCEIARMLLEAAKFVGKVLTDRWEHSEQHFHICYGDLGVSNASVHSRSGLSSIHLRLRQVLARESLQGDESTSCR